MSNKKFFKWLLLADFIFVVIIAVVGIIFIQDNIEKRAYLLGQGVGTFIVFSNLSAILLYFFWYKKQKGK